jgi:uncharacterized protein
MVNPAFDFLLGLGFGFVSGTIGITGGVIAVPVLVLLGLGQHVAQGTSLVMQLPTGLVALWQYARRSRIGREIMIVTAAASAIATFIGARLAIHTAEEPMRRSFAIFLALLATFTIWSMYSHKARTQKLRWYSASAVAASGGFCAGLFGVGGATFTIPLFGLLFGLSQTEAQGMGLAVVLPAIAIAIPTYAAAGLADWRIGVVLGIGAVCAVGFGVMLAHKLPQRVLRTVFSLFLYSGAIVLWLRA